MQFKASCCTLVPPGKAFSAVSDPQRKHDVQFGEKKKTPLRQFQRPRHHKTAINHKSIPHFRPIQPKTKDFLRYKDTHIDTNTSDAGTLKIHGCVHPLKREQKFVMSRPLQQHQQLARCGPLVFLSLCASWKYLLPAFVTT